MTTQLEIDRFGRILIPKALREALKLQAGEALEAEITQGTLQLRPLTRTTTLLEHAGRLVLAPYDQTKHVISDDVVEEFREGHLQEIPGEWS